MKKSKIGNIIGMIAGGLLMALPFGLMAEEKKIGLVTIGASFWSAGGTGCKILKAMLESRGYKADTDTSRGNPMAFQRLQMFKEGRQGELMKAHQTEKARQQAEKDVNSCLADVSSKPWNFVCFQAHSSEPFEDPEGLRLPPYIEGIKAKMAPGAKLVACMTWVKDPGKQNYEAIRKYYHATAEKYGLLLAPSGDAFEIVERDRKDIPIFRSDTEEYKTKNTGKIDRHPSIYGQYLNCCVVFAVITGESPVGLPAELPGIIDDFEDKEGAGLKAPMKLSPEVAKYLQETALKVVEAVKEKNAGK